MKKEMNIFEMFFFLLMIFLSVLFGRFFWRYIGWWGVIPACVLGFGAVVLFLNLLNKLPSPRPPTKKGGE